MSATLNVSVLPAGPIVPADAMVGVPIALETSASAVVVVVLAAVVVVVVVGAAVVSGLEVADVGAASGTRDEYRGEHHGGG